MRQDTDRQRLELDERLREADAETDPRVRAQTVLRAVHEFVSEADNGPLLAARTLLQERTAGIAAAAPEQSVRLLARLGGWFALEPETTHAVFAQWLRTPEPGAFSDTWDAIGELLSETPALVEWMATTVRSGDAVVSAEFRRLAVTHLTEVVDRDFSHYELTSSPVWQLLYALGPAGRGDWFLLFGDRAAERGEDVEAARRYELAERFGGGAAARERLRGLHDITAYNRLVSGVTVADKLKGPGTASPFRTLVLGAAAVVADRPGPDLADVARGKDEALRLPARLVTALALLRAGDRDAARAQLRTLVDDTAEFGGGAPGHGSSGGRTPGDAAHPATGNPSADDRAASVRDGDTPADPAIAPAAGSNTGVAANIRLVLGALDDNGSLIAAAARALFARYRQEWSAHALVDAATVLTAVAEHDPALLPELIGGVGAENGSTELHALRLATAREDLAKAARAAVLSCFDETAALLARAHLLLAGAEGDDAAALREKATRIAETVARLPRDADRPLDRLAFAALREDGIVQPWTPSALRLWRENDQLAQSNSSRAEAPPTRSSGALATDGTGSTDALGTPSSSETAADDARRPASSGPGDAPIADAPPAVAASHSLHHLAVATHARAYQLEIAGEDTAFEQWRLALGYWARLQTDDAYWERLGAHIAAVTPDALPEEIERAVVEARAELPGQVLEPHVTRVQELRRDQLDRAREHLDLIRHSEFAAADVGRARARLAREAGAQIRRLIRENNLDRALAEVQAWIEIDSDNIPLAEQALDVGIETVETEHRRDSKHWAENSRPMLERIAALVEPMSAELGLTQRRLAIGDRPTSQEPDRVAYAAKLARHEFWLGAALVVSTSQRVSKNPFEDRSGFRSGAGHLNTALMLGLPGIAPYDQGRQLLVSAGRLERHMQGGSALGFL
ncbi:hypothetical protein [Nocardia jejuensis]|uniref:hypothetical protein n=1 Tax=Nocardia jejuensis TaxID=328049 RepID=UPI00082DABD4|nr:hypothetical protein [Nocardia jejuensis]